MKKRSTAAAFSLVELTLALGVAAFCLVAVFGLVPVGVQTNRNATSQTAATNILSSVVSDIRGSPPSQSNTAKYQISRAKGTLTRLCFDGQGGYTKLTGINTVCPAPYTRYRLYVQTANNPNQVLYPNYVYLKVIWPAAVDPIANVFVKPSGSVETVTAYFSK
jgi:uncharacterized protein (TIGR02598 family)